MACAIAKSEKYNVFGLDIDKNKIDSINNRVSPIEDDTAGKDIKSVSINATVDAEVLA